MSLFSKSMQRPEQQTYCRAMYDQECLDQVRLGRCRIEHNQSRKKGGSHILSSDCLFLQAWDLRGEAPECIRGSVHVIVGSHAMRRIGNVRQALQNIHSALAEGGFLLLNELTESFSTCLWGLQDMAAEPSGCLGWSVADWREALEQAGFAEVTTLW